jgi:hypothetical protein
MDCTSINVGTERNEQYEHVHADGTRNKSDRTIPKLNDERPRQWRAWFTCH